MTGTMLSGSVVEKFGCLWTLRIGMMFEFVGWILIIFVGDNFKQLIGGRVMNGLGGGLCIPAAYMILTDLSLVRFRGIFAVLNSSSCNLGFLFGLVMGAKCRYETVALYCCGASSLFLIISSILPESPLWLVKHGYEEKATKIIQVIRGEDYQAAMEVKEMTACANVDEEYSFKTVLKSSFKQEFLRPFGILLFLVTVQGLCGCDTLSYYSTMVFKAAKIDINEYLMAIFLQLGFTAGYIFIAPFMDSIDRRKLFMTASSLMSASLIVLGATISPPTEEEQGHKIVAKEIWDGEVVAIDKHDIFPAGFNGTKVPSDYSDEKTIWRIIFQFGPPFCAVLYSFSYGAGFGPSIYTWASEIFPTKTKSLGSSACLGFRNVVVFIVLKLYPFMISSLGLSNLFYLHSTSLVVGFIFVFCFMPETRGLTITQISQLFRAGPAPEVKDSLKAIATIEKIASEYMMKIEPDMEQIERLMPQESLDSDDSAADTSSLNIHFTVEGDENDEIV